MYSVRAIVVTNTRNDDVDLPAVSQCCYAYQLYGMHMEQVLGQELVHTVTFCIHATVHAMETLGQCFYQQQG